MFVTVAPKKLASRELDAGVEASGPHDFAVRVGAVVCSAIASTAFLPASVTIAKRPSIGSERDRW